MVADRWTWSQTGGHGRRPVDMVADRWTWSQTGGHGRRPVDMVADRAVVATRANVVALAFAARGFELPCTDGLAVSDAPDPPGRRPAPVRSFRRSTGRSAPGTVSSEQSGSSKTTAPASRRNGVRRRWPCDSCGGSPRTGGAAHPHDRRQQRAIDRHPVGVDHRRSTPRSGRPDALHAGRPRRPPSPGPRATPRCEGPCVEFGQTAHPEADELVRGATLDPAGELRRPESRARVGHHQRVPAHRSRAGRAATARTSGSSCKS